MSEPDSKINKAAAKYPEELSGYEYVDEPPGARVRRDALRAETIPRQIGEGFRTQLIANTAAFFVVGVSIIAGVVAGGVRDAHSLHIGIDSPQTLLRHGQLVSVLVAATTVYSLMATLLNLFAVYRHRETPAIRRLEQKITEAFGQALDESAANPKMHRSIILSDGIADLASTKPGRGTHASAV